LKYLCYAFSVTYLWLVGLNFNSLSQIVGLLKHAQDRRLFHKSYMFNNYTLTWLGEMVETSS